MENQGKNRKKCIKNDHTSYEVWSSNKPLYYSDISSLVLNSYYKYLFLFNLSIALSTEIVSAPSSTSFSAS